jgi:hypothetical protein
LCETACDRQKTFSSRAAKGKVKVQAAWNAEPFEPIDHKEKEIEEMMERMTLEGRSGPGMDVFSREEMMELRGAMNAGDYERVQELDPTFSSLDEREFDMLRQMGQESAQSDDGDEDRGDAAPAFVGVEEREPGSSASWFGRVNEWLLGLLG